MLRKKQSERERVREERRERTMAERRCEEFFDCNTVRGKKKETQVVTWMRELWVRVKEKMEGERNI